MCLCRDAKLCTARSQVASWKPGANAASVGLSMGSFRATIGVSTLAAVDQANAGELVDDIWNCGFLIGEMNEN